MTISDEELRDLLTESIKTAMICEKVRSKKFADAIKAHGGLEYGDWSSEFGNDLYNMTDEDFDDYVVVDRKKHYNRYGINGYDNPERYDNTNFKPIEFKDGTFMVKKDPTRRWDDREKAWRDKKTERYNLSRFDGGRDYQYENPYLNQLINQESDRGSKPRGRWMIPGETKKVKGLGGTNLNPLALKQMHIQNTYKYGSPERKAKERELSNGNYEENDLDKNIVGRAWKSKNNLKENNNTMDRKQTIRMNEEQLRNFVNEAVKRILNESRNTFITIELPGNVAEDDNVLSVIRKAMGQIGYEYYDNHSGGYNGGSWIYRYAPRQAPVGVQMY